MKKIITVLALLLCLALMTGCGAQAFLHDVAEHLVNNPPAESVETEDLVTDGESQPATASDAAEEPGTESEEVFASASDTGEQIPKSQLPEEDGHIVDFSSLSVSECVTDADGAAGQLPRIVLDCPGADYINDDIEGTFRYLVGADYCTLYYDVSKNGPILSILIAQLYDGNASYYTPYRLDLSTGEAIDGAELLSYLGMSSDELAAAELQIMGEEFEYQYGAQSTGDLADIYAEQYDMTVSPANAELNRLWLDSEGELNFVAKIYSLAGAEFYEYPMGTGYYY